MGVSRKSGWESLGRRHTASGPTPGHASAEVVCPIWKADDRRHGPTQPCSLFALDCLNLLGGYSAICLLQRAATIYLPLNIVELLQNVMQDARIAYGLEH